MARFNSSNEYVPDWDIDDGRRARFAPENRRTKEEILAEIEAEKNREANGDNKSSDLMNDGFPHSSFDLSHFSHPQSVKKGEYKQSETGGIRNSSPFPLNSSSFDSGIDSGINPDFITGMNMGNTEGELEIEEERRGILVWLRWLIVLLAFIGLAAGLVYFGYLNTDFDNHGTAYTIPLELRYERSYIAKSDELLNEILLLDGTLKENIQNLPKDYVGCSTKLNEANKKLQSVTNEVSRYVGVPVKFESYHKQLINFSLNLQSFIAKAEDTYSQEGFDEYALNALADYEISLEEVKQSRLQTENEIFRNMGDSSDLLKEGENALEKQSESKQR